MLYIDKNKKISDSEFKKIIDSVDLYDICNYIISLDSESWVPVSYWSRAKAKLHKDPEKQILKDPHYGEMIWAIYSYLVHNEILMIKNEHSLKGDIRKKDSYYNLLEAPLYHPILTRLIDEGFLIRTYQNNPSSVYSFNDGYKIGSSYNRMSNLEKLNI